MSQTPQELRDRIIDEEHLRLLVIGHYITGGLCIGFASLFIFHLIFLIFAILNPGWFSDHATSAGPPDGTFKAFAAALGVLIAMGWTFGGLTIYAGRCINKRVHRSFTFVMAALNLFFIPFGTVLGVFTLMVLSKPGIKRIYGL